MKLKFAPFHKVWIARFLVNLKSLVARYLDLRYSISSRSSESSRATALAMMAALPSIAEEVRGYIILDGSFNNPNYWWRLSLFWAACGKPRAVGLIGEHQALDCRKILNALGISRVHEFGAKNTLHRKDARSLLIDCKSQADLLGLQLPEDFPPATLYDHVLKRQRAATVQLDHPLLEDHVAEILAAIAAAKKWLDVNPPDSIALSHSINPLGAALAWLGQRRKIPVFILFGNYGVPRFWKVNRPADFWHGIDCPNGADIEALTEKQASALAQVGEQYITKRLAGQTTDLATRFAFRGGLSPGRALLAKQFGWNENRPVVSVYASNWFDYPHAMGMTQFVDFLDWIKVTLEAAIRNTEVNWLFRAHPVDEWYGGVSLNAVFPNVPPAHVRMCPLDWSGAAVTSFSDALVTYHGTAAIEYAALGKPVLVADRGWYHDCGFVQWPQSRADYVSALGHEWWKSMDIATAKKRAHIFSGWYFCVPQWQENLILLDDSLQGELYSKLLELLKNHDHTIRKELDWIRRWLDSKTNFYHTFKMLNTDSFMLSNTI